MTPAIDFTVNGHVRSVQTSPARPVLDVLRDDLGLTGTKEGCSVGVCGACSILVDGRLMSAPACCRSAWSPAAR